MLARRVPSILPDFTLEEALATTRIHSGVGTLLTIGISDSAFEITQTLGLLRFNRLTGLNRFNPKTCGLPPLCLRLTHDVTGMSHTLCSQRQAEKGEVRIEFLL